MDFLQPPDPPEDGHCLRCGAFVIRDEQRAGICIDCQPVEDGSHPAFPVRASEYGGHGTCFGVSTRDYFAAKAMNGYLANAWQAKELDETGDSSTEQMRIVAEISYAMADAMLAARTK